MKNIKNDDKEQGPKLCKQGCLFFGSSSTQDLFSNCDQDFVKLFMNLKKLAANESSSTGTISIASKRISKSRNRCEICKKKVGLLGFQCCHCSGYYCGTHRFPEEHRDCCSFDFKTAGRFILAKQIPLVVRDKLDTRV